MADLLSDALPKQNFFHGGFGQLTDEGLPRYIEEKYNQTLNKALWFAYDGMWRATASGAVKGVLIAAATVMVGTAAFGALAMGSTLAIGVGQGLAVGVATLTSAPVALPILGMGALLGAAHDHETRQNTIQKELNELKKMIRDYVGIKREEALEADPNRVPGEGIEPIRKPQASQETAPESVNDYWQQRVAKEQASSARGRP
jgi:hypothetical protein